MRVLCLILLITISLTAFCQSTNCKVCSYDTKVRFNGKKVTEILSLELQINNGAGTEYAEVSIPFSENNKVEDLEACIYDLSGNEIRKLKKKDIQIETPWSYSNFHSDDRLLSFKLIHTSYPYILKYSYKYVTKNYISLTHWTPIFNKKLKVNTASLHVEVPRGLDIRLYEQKTQPAEIRHEEETTTYNWRVKNFTANKEESFSPDFYDVNPYVIVMAEDFHYGVDGKSNTWKDLGNWECNLIEGLDSLTEKEKNIVYQLTDSMDSDLEKTRALYHYLQDNTRYINVSLDIGGHLPYPASYVCINRYGDCKALTNYMKALLKEVGIESVYTTIYADIKPRRVKKDFPSEHANHVILSVPMNRDTIWLECTDKTAPFNYIGASSQNRLALFNLPNTSQLVQTPKHSLADALESYMTKININKNVTFNSSGKLKGRKYDYFKGFDTNLSPNDKKAYVDNVNFSHNADIQSVEIERANRDSTYLNIKLNGNSLQITEKLGNSILLSPFKAINYKLTPIEERKSDIFVYYPVNKCDTIIYAFDKNIALVKGLTTEEVNSEFGVYRRDFTIKDNELIITRTFQLNQNLYDIGKYENFYEFVSKACRLDQQKTLITF
ncbi:DUF3857 domain-containing protein [Saccharicrinis sp. 156]|uniref:DUF3857 domain-containing protein n=1 Tax=Saccharicrinis sp. 156 TaxID=3417574 RepID=UPI003D345725